MSFELYEPLPTIRVSADGPYHVYYPVGVTVSEFISSRAIEPFYDVLEELVAAGATVSIWEMDQDLGGPRGPKGWYGSSCITGVTGTIGPQEPPPVQDRIRYGLEELAVKISWQHGAHIETPQSLTVSPLLSNLKEHYPKIDGRPCHESCHVTRGVTVTMLVMIKPLFIEVLKAYQTQSPTWTAGTLFTHMRNRHHELCDDNDQDQDYETREREVDQNMDPMLFDILTITDSNPERILEKVGGRLVLHQNEHVVMVKTGEVLHKYSVALQALDLRVNKDTILGWLKPSRNE